MIRIDKVLGNMGYGSRRELKRDFRRGGIVLNGKPVKSSHTTMDPEKDELYFYGEKVEYRPYIYLLMNKPEGFVSTTEGPDSVLHLVADLLYYDLHLVGRLDKDTTGMLLITNDGEYTHAITSPKNKIPKVYEVITKYPLQEELVEKFREGIYIRDEQERTAPAILEIIQPLKAYLTIIEGRFHQVKKMFEAVDNEVEELKRIQIGELELGDLSLGEVVELGEEELDLTMKSLDIK